MYVSYALSLGIFTEKVFHWLPWWQDSRPRLHRTQGTGLHEAKRFNMAFWKQNSSGHVLLESKRHWNLWRPNYSGGIGRGPRNFGGFEEDSELRKSDFFRLSDFDRRKKGKWEWMAGKFRFSHVSHLDQWGNGSDFDHQPLRRKLFWY